MTTDRTTASLGDVQGQGGGILGPYRLLSVLGEGGFGRVWLAEQREPVERRVALKVIRPGLDPQKVLARFEAEGQALAMMDHPGVAKVLDAGTSEDGLPYFAIEYVRGTAITNFCDSEGLGLDDRVRLMIQVCEAVHHAHMKGVVHRDLKPGNILVERIDGRPAPKVIDFGIAKALYRPLTDRPLHTEQGQLLGTPEYMSPEQARGGADIDTRADVYSLGAILYELLTGDPPLDVHAAREQGIGEVIRRIVQIDPPRPSTRVASPGLSESGGTSSDTARAASHGGAHPAGRPRTHGPRVDPATLSRSLRGELDWIAMKCLEKERSRRYDSAAALARDLQRYLDDEAVEAGPPSAAYKLSKFVHRHRGVVVAGAVAIIALLGATIATSWGLGEALRERRHADEARGAAESARDSAERDRATAVRERARAETERADAARARDEAEAVTAFLASTLESADPEETGRDVTVREVLDRAGQSVGERFAGRPLIEARLRQTIANSYRGLGRYAEADAHLEAALGLLTAELGPRDGRTLRAMGNLAGLRHEQGRFAEAADLGSRTVEGLRAAGLGERPITLGAMNNLAQTLSRLGRTSDALALQQEVAELQERIQGPDHPHTLGAWTNLALQLEAAGRLEEAHDVLERALAGWTRAFGPDHPGTLLATSNLGGLALAAQDYPAAERLYRVVWEGRSRILGEHHPETIRARINVGFAIDRQDRRDEAESEYLACWAQAPGALGPDHADTVTLAMNLAGLYERLGWPERSRDLVRELCSSMSRIAAIEWAAPSELNSAAWLLLTARPEHCRDAPGALAAAERACAAERSSGAGGSAGPRLWEYLDTLALARAGVGDTRGALSAQREALLLLPASAESRRPEMEQRLAEYARSLR